jgi:hypothetical protein
MRAELQDNHGRVSWVITALTPRVLSLTLMACILPTLHCPSLAREPNSQDNASSRETQSDAKRRLPLQHMRRDAQEMVNDVIENPSFFRRMPMQTIECDPQLFKFIVRYPEVLVNIWDVMGITKVQINRTGPYTFTADDSVGTTCKCDLVYGNEQVHVYYGTGVYKGNMTPRQVTGRCVCVLHSTSTTAPDGSPMVTGLMDVFLKLDNLGADILTRTLAPFVGKTADYNFVESAKFISQISQVCENNPEGAETLASKLHKVQPEVRDEFARIAQQVGEAAQKRFESQQLATLKVPRTQLTARETVPVAEAESTGRTVLPPHPQPRPENVGMRMSDSTGVRSEQFAPTAQQPAPMTGTRVAPSTISDYSAPGPRITPAPERSVAPQKPSIYMRR